MMRGIKSNKLISDELNNDSKIEKKQIEILCDTTQKLTTLCNKKDLKVSDLKWQPHYSTVFKQLKQQLEMILASDSSKNLELLNNIPYLLQLKNNLINMFNDFAKFVQDNGSLIGTKDHHMRKTFFMRVVHFQFLSFEIQGYFPNGHYNPTNVKISKTPAKIWWEKKFYNNIFVDIDTFVTKFKEDFPFINQAEIYSFKKSINFTATNFTTTFEYDLFTRLYSPWEKIIEVWRLIYSHPAYLHFSTYGDTKDTLSKYLNEPGTYVFRISCKDLGFWTIGYVKPTKEMGQVKVDKSNLIEALVEGNKKNMYLYPNGESSNPDLSSLNDYRKQIIVNNEDLQLYDCFEDFKECKICRESEKDLQLESCGHQICQSCFKLLRKYDKKNCPFCNQKILSTTKIVNVTDPSVYVDATTNVDREYTIMTSPTRSSSNEPLKGVETRSKDGSRPNADSVYSNISDDANEPEQGPAVPPRVIHDNNWIPKPETKKCFINYPPIPKSRSPINVRKEESSEKKSESKVNNLLVYSEMSSPTPKNSSYMTGVNEDLYCDVTSPGSLKPTSDNLNYKHHLYSTVNESKNQPYQKVDDDDTYCDVTAPGPIIPNESVSSTPHKTYTNNNYSNTLNSKAPVDKDLYCDLSVPGSNSATLPNYTHSQRNSKTNSLIQELNNRINSQELNKTDFISNTSINSHKAFSERIHTSDDIYCCPSEDAHLNRGKDNNDDIYAVPDESVVTPPVINPKCSNTELVDDIYLNPNENVFSNYANLEFESQVFPDDTYYDPNENGSFNHLNDSINHQRSASETYYDEDEKTNENIFTSLKKEMLSFWSNEDVERALRVARYDECLAKDILTEFVPRR